MPRPAAFSLHEMETDTFHSAIVDVRTEGKHASATGSVDVMDTVETACDVVSSSVGLAASATVAENKTVLVKAASC
ncbi:hypothetical protein E2C01_075992 [Portunus trituberculatus]|uniref:Uncharacterized protein n=1 Tax=Portunus trituberculatus TaxID=210409 RepID=A0A5B7IHS5_PORTR|nr:hypothetical protein [Portunus trituberculatus]